MMALLNKMRNNLGLIACYVAIFAAIAMVVYPTLWVVSSALNPGTSLSTSAGLIPANPTLENFEQLLFGDKYPYIQWYINTLKVCTIASLLSVVLTAGTAYAFSKFRFKG